MTQTISLSGLWKLSPCQDDAVKKYTTFFEKHKYLEINTANSIYTELIAAKAVSEKIRYLSDMKWIIERKFTIPGKTGYCVLKMPEALQLEINGERPKSEDITSLLKNGDNTIKAVVNTSFCGEASLVLTDTGVIYSAHLKPRHENGKWIIKAEIDYGSFSKRKTVLGLSLLGRSKTIDIELNEERKLIETELEIEDSLVECWNIAGHGKQILYTAELELGEEKLDRRVAFRTIEIIDGALFVNGKETFAKGAVWPVMAHHDQRRYEDLLLSAAKANINVLFITSGHESHMFYNITDRLGIIVLHPESVEGYPYHPSFMHGSINCDIFDATARKDKGYLGLFLDAIDLERWVLKTRSCNTNHGVVYDNLLSTVAMNGSWKPSHYAARRFFADLVPIMFIENGMLSVFISNDGDKDEDVEISIKFMEYSGQKRQKQIYNTKVPMHSAVKIKDIDLRGHDRKKEFVYVKLRTFDLHRELTLLLDEIVDCAYQEPGLEYSVRKINGKSFSIRIKCQKPAFAVHLEMENIPGLFSDSFFEVRPSGEKSVVFNSYSEISEEDINRNLRIYDIYSALKEQNLI